MHTAYLDCFSGVSGDMLLGALLDCGVPEDYLRGVLAALPLGWLLQPRLKLDVPTLNRIQVYVVMPAFEIDTVQLPLGLYTVPSTDHRSSTPW